MIKVDHIVDILDVVISQELLIPWSLVFAMNWVLVIREVKTDAALDYGNRDCFEKKVGDFVQKD